MSTDNVSTPRFPDAPKTWASHWMNDYTRVLTAWIIRLVSSSEEETGETAVSIISSSYSIGMRDGFVIVDTTSGVITVTLPNAVRSSGRHFWIKRSNAGGNNCNVGSAGGGIDGHGTVVLTAQLSGINVKSDGYNWWIISSTGAYTLS